MYMYVVLKYEINMFKLRCTRRVVQVSYEGLTVTNNSGWHSFNGIGETRKGVAKEKGKQSLHQENMSV